MQKIISDCLVFDFLGGSVPIYDVDYDDTQICMLNFDVSIKEENIPSDKRILLSLIDLPEKWERPQYRKDPQFLKESLEKLLLATAKLSPIVKVNDLREAIAVSETVLIEGENYLSNAILCAPNFIQKNVQTLVELNIDRMFIPVSKMKDNHLIVLPPSEFVGPLALQDYDKFGAFALPKYIVNVELSE